MIFVTYAYWIADVGGRDDGGVKEESEELDNGVEVEEHEDLLAS